MRASRIRAPPARPGVAAGGALAASGSTSVDRVAMPATLPPRWTRDKNHFAMSAMVHSGPDLLLEVDRADGRPLRDQIEAALRAGIREGRLHPGTRLPSTRALAQRLGVARGVVSDAYGQLAAEGW